MCDTFLFSDIQSKFKKVMWILKIILEILTDYRPWAPVSMKKFLWGGEEFVCVCVHACAHLCLASAWMVGQIWSVFVIEEFIHPLGVGAWWIWTICVLFDILTAVAMTGSLSWDITPCSLMVVNRHFRGTYHFCLMPASCWFHVRCTFHPWR
jgi:hypothetical protein